METTGKKKMDDRLRGAGFPLCRALFFLFPWSFFLSLTGCQGLNQLTGPDPLLGKAAAPIGNKPVVPADPAPVASLPSPNVNASASTAALAAGATPAVDGRHNLRIEDPIPAPGGQSWRGQPPAGGTPVLQRPEPIAAEPGPIAERSSPYSVGLVSGSRVMTYDQAQEQLKTRGILWQRLEMVADQGKWKFSCSVPNRQNRMINRTYEAVADTDLAAMQAVLDQMDKK
jgi:hypothetical protein